METRNYKQPRRDTAFLDTINNSTRRSLYRRCVSWRFISKIKITGEKAILNLEDSNSIESAQLLKGSALYLPLTALPELSDHQFYFHEIIGYVVQDENLGEIGQVITVYDAGPQDLLAIDHKNKEVLLPINDKTVIKVDKNKKKIFVNLPDGLLDIYLSEDNNEDWHHYHIA